MAHMTVQVWDATGNKRQEVELPDDAPVNRILAVLLEKMRLPQTAPDGQPLSYKFHHKRTGRQLLDEQCLGEAGVQPGDVLRLNPEITAGVAAPPKCGVRLRNNPMSSHRRLAVAVVLLVGVISTISGCGISALPPPVTVSYRSSLLGIGQVVVINNNSSHHLYNVSVVGRNFEEVLSASVKATDHLTPGSSVEVGWLEFENWVPQPGETIEVYADNYATPKVSIIPSN